MPDRPGPNPAWLIPAVAETGMFDLEHGARLICKCTYCDHEWTVFPEEDEEREQWP